MLKATEVEQKIYRETKRKGGGQRGWKGEFAYVWACVWPINRNRKARDREQEIKESWGRELEGATGQLKTGKDGLQKLLCWTHGEKHIGCWMASSWMEKQTVYLRANMTHKGFYRSVFVLCYIIYPKSEWHPLKFVIQVRPEQQQFIQFPPSSLAKCRDQRKSCLFFLSALSKLRRSYPHPLSVMSGLWGETNLTSVCSTRIYSDSRINHHAHVKYLEELQISERVEVPVLTASVSRHYTVCVHIFKPIWVELFCFFWSVGSSVTTLHYAYLVKQICGQNSWTHIYTDECTVSRKFSLLLVQFWSPPPPPDRNIWLFVG